jgi:hypothetical protein
MTDDAETCEEQLERLEEENARLREAASAFGALAERLNHELREERRLSQSDRRMLVREKPDRRRG